MKLLPKIGKGVRNLGNYVHSFTPGAYAHKRSMKAWREQTAYNTPKNQVQRLREAGLAPQLMYGQGASASVGNADPAPEQNPTEGAGLLSVLGKFVEGIKAVSETQRQRSITEGQNIENIWNRYFTLGKLDKGRTVQSSERSWLLDRESTLTHWKGMLTKREVNRVEAMINKLRQDTRWQKFENDFRDTYKINTSDGWRIRLATAIIEVLGGNISDQNILKLLGVNKSQ